MRIFVREKGKADKATWIMLMVFWVFLMAASVSALESADSGVGELGQDLYVTLTGGGLDGKTGASTVLDVGRMKAIIDSVDTPGSANGVTVIGDTAYVADGLWGLQIIDVSDPSSPETIGSVDTPGTANGVAVTGGTAYVADGLWGLQIIDVSDPSSPEIVGSVDTPGTANGVAVTGDTAYVADGLWGLQIIDVGDPSSPKMIDSVDTPGRAKGVTVIGDTAYVADNEGGLVIVSLPTSGATKGDINGDGNVNLADAILALQVLIGLEPEPPLTVHKDADVNLDARIGLEEAVYVMHRVAGVRQ